MKCCKEKDLQVLMSAAGYYIGTMDETYGPYCRISEYYPTRDKAEKAMRNGFKERVCMENIDCSGGDCLDE